MDPTLSRLSFIDRKKTMESKPTSSSRLCIKGLPKTLMDERKLKDHFSSRGGDITDLKLLKTKEGLSRQMAFIGFRSESEAEAARKYYDNTFMGTQRITVEFAFKVGGAGDADHRPWSRHSEGSSSRLREERAMQQQPLLPTSSAVGSNGAKGKVKTEESGGVKSVKGKAVSDKEGAQGLGVKSVKGKAVSDKEGAQGLGPGGGAGGAGGAGGEVVDPKLQEFLNLMAPRSKAKVWANDDIQDKEEKRSQDQTQGSKGKGKGKQEEGKVALMAMADSDEEEEYQELKLKAVDLTNINLKKQKEKDEEEEEEEKKRPAAPATVLSDLDYLKSKVASKSWSDDEDEEDDKVEDGHKGAAPLPLPPLKIKSKVSSETVKALPIKGRLSRGVMVVDGASQEKAAKGDKKARGGGGGGGDDHMEEEVEPSQDNNDNEMEEREEGVVEEGNENEQDVAEEVKTEDPSSAARDRPSSSFPPSQSSSTTGRLFIRNLAYTVSESDLSDLFSSHGDLSEVHLVLDRGTRKSKGTAFVLFANPESAQEAKASLDATIFQGRLIHILDAELPRSTAKKDGEECEEGGGGGGDKQQGFRAEKAAKRLASVGDKVTWNSLFMRPDTVAEAIAAIYKVTKGELLDRSASDLPVRMALGEAQVAQQTKKELKDLGVDVDKLEEAARAAGKGSGSNSKSNGVPRSPQILLVKNLPYSADVDELRELFSGLSSTSRENNTSTSTLRPSASTSTSTLRPSASITRIVLPETRALALVEFAEPQDARHAFKSLAYKKYHHVPLYLEWAPKDIFHHAPPLAHTSDASKGSKPGSSATAAKSQSEDVRAGLAAPSSSHGATDEEGGGGGGSSSHSIFVKNLAFATTDESLRKHFDRSVSSRGGFIRSAKVARKAGTDGKMTLSMGFGFIEVDREEIAKAVIKEKQGSMLDGHKLSLQLSRSSNASSDSDKKKAKAKRKGEVLVGDEEEGSSKLVVRNVAFEATRKDLVALFGPFGHLKSCRLPKKFDGSHRGFAFIEFVTQQEAKNATEGLTGTHLYGRRLVVEVAQEDPEEAGDVDRLRARTGDRFSKRVKREADVAASTRGRGSGGTGGDFLANSHDEEMD